MSGVQGSTHAFVFSFLLGLLLERVLSDCALWVAITHAKMLRQFYMFPFVCLLLRLPFIFCFICSVFFLYFQVQRETYTIHGGEVQPDKKGN
jgi:hypothetical protein